jgi:drug/metabolite transporter (DMT)-like permease
MQERPSGAVGRTPSLLQGYLLLAVTVLIWGGYMPVGKVLSAQIDVYWLTFIRYLLAGALLGLFIAWREGWQAVTFPRKDFWSLLMLGALGSAGFGLFSYLGVRLTRPEHAAAISVMTPINVAVWRAIETRRLPPRSVIACILAVVGGAILVVTRGRIDTLFSGGSLIGDLLVFIGSLCWTFYTIRAQAMVGYSAVRLTAIGCLLGSPVGLALALTMTGLGQATVPSLAALAGLWPQMLYLVVAVSIVSIVTWNAAVRAVGAQDATLMSAFMPVIPFAWAYGQGQIFTALEVLGAALIVAAICAHNISERRRLLRISV